jgi:hypothetical protein
MSEKNSADKELEILGVWYETYMKIIRSLGTVAVTIILVTSNLLLSDIITEEKIAKDNKMNALGVIQESFFFLVLSLIFVFLCMIFTYNWYRTGIALAMKNIKNSIMPDKFWYHKAWLSMSSTGALSWVFGGLAGIALIIGIVIFTMKIPEFLEIVIGFEE